MWRNCSEKVNTASLIPTNDRSEGMFRGTQVRRQQWKRSLCQKEIVKVESGKTAKEEAGRGGGQSLGDGAAVSGGECKRAKLNAA